ncbi:hypothetical protein PRIPAC_74972 [Pristionchus pacificus]|uniref:NADAR domain-containing protein n=1 Tax=Pristionchus pacificus TaxID=54126 RepID=A0A2A6C0J4_PRIPA|nr:hypothetical protein PRIPAC_74972 [Pristionchus pacificus]|eukprot:PDM71533.1 hypothetical protein PRIPAC_37940 [Pristionchus pacificus]
MGKGGKTRSEMTHTILLTASKDGGDKEEKKIVEPTLRQHFFKRNNKLKQQIMLMEVSGFQIHVPFTMLVAGGTEREYFCMAQPTADESSHLKQLPGATTGRAALSGGRAPATAPIQPQSSNSARPFTPLLACIDLRLVEHLISGIINSNQKYMQSAKCRKSLLQTGDDIFVQCSIFNKKWGCGLSIDHPDVADPSKWQGENRFGKILTLARNHLRTIDVMIN